MTRATKRQAPPPNKRGRPSPAIARQAIARQVQEEAAKRGLAKTLVDRALGGDAQALAIVSKLALPEWDSTLSMSLPMMKWTTEAGRRAAIDELSARVARREIGVEEAAALMSLIERCATLDVSMLIARFEEQQLIFGPASGTPAADASDPGAGAHGIRRLASLAAASRAA